MRVSLSVSVSANFGVKIEVNLVLEIVVVNRCS